MDRCIGRHTRLYAGRLLREIRSCLIVNVFLLFCNNAYILSLQQSIEYGSLQTGHLTRLLHMCGIAFWKKFVWYYQTYFKWGFVNTNRLMKKLHWKLGRCIFVICLRQYLSYTFIVTEKIPNTSIFCQYTSLKSSDADWVQGGNWVGRCKWQLGHTRASSSDTHLHSH